MKCFAGLALCLAAMTMALPTDLGSSVATAHTDAQEYDTAPTNDTASFNSTTPANDTAPATGPDGDEKGKTSGGTRTNATSPLVPLQRQPETVAPRTAGAKDTMQDRVPKRDSAEGRGDWGYGWSAEVIARDLDLITRQIPMVLSSQQEAVSEVLQFP
ncbi:Uu.00g141000.m01.CDS01 [Anthostomella pinea]|uniref:Uu.00g141000.m01.CDS01 n=1 Tax=Anthostomella pinea TaxID=933095 RepID=A0AAI8VR02_9PEZI|nr:Uu.00g141000.m01.CDS01 [Anthostomella pinea]